MVEMKSGNEAECMSEDERMRLKCDAGLNDRSEAVLGMELRVRIEEDRFDHFEEGMEHLTAFDQTLHGNQRFEETMEKSMNVLAETAKAAVSDPEVSESVEGEALIGNDQSHAKETLINGCSMELDVCRASIKYRGMDQMLEMESGKKHGAEIVTEAVIFNDADEERNKEKCGLSIDRKRINPEAEGLERPKKSPKLEEDDKKIVNLSSGLNLEDCHNHMPETTQENKLETLGCKEAEGTVVARAPRYKKRKIALFVAYCGVGYQGMQRNPGAVTIEGELEEALFKAGAIAECNFGDPRKVDWMRAARTDKGVSAVGQIVSGRFFIDPPGFVERVNFYLPGKIRVLGFKRVTNTFSARKMCDRRRYEYVLPVFAFDPSVHLGRESMKGLELEDNVIRCNEDWQEKEGESADVKKIVLDIANSLEHTSSNILHGGSVSKNLVQGTECGVGVESLEILQESMGAENTDDGMVVQHSTKSAASFKGEIAPKQDVSNISLQNEDKLLGSVAASLESETGSKEASKKSEFEFGDKHIAQLNNVLGHYVGTHNFHNFTSRIKAEDPSAIRYIVSFEASVFTIGSMEFVRCKVVGQSFMLHQIRKMIGLAVAIMRGCTPVSTIKTALKRNVKINVPMAPELGLFLDECMYTAYDIEFSSSHEKISLHDFEKEIADFKWKQIYSHIATTEARDGVVALWLHSLNDRNFPDFVLERQKTK